MKKNILFCFFFLFSLLVSAQSWKELNNQVLELFKKKEYLKALPIAEKSVETAKRDSGENHACYATTLNNLAGVYRNLGQYEKAETKYLQAVSIRKKALGENDPNYVSSLNSLAGVYLSMGQYEKAEPYFIQVKEIRKKNLGEKDPDYANTLNNLAGIYKSMGQYEKAEPLFVQALEIRKKSLGEEHPNYIISLYNLAGLYKSMGQYEKAEPLYILVKEIRKNILGENHPDVLKSLNDLSALYVNMGQYEKAAPIFIKSLEIIMKRESGENNIDYATALNNLASVYESMGKYEKAEPLYIQSKEIWKKIAGENSPDYATVLNNLAYIYESMGQYEKAEPLYIQAKEIDNKALKKTHPNYFRDLNNLAALYAVMRQYDKAALLYVQSTEIQKKISGDKHPDYATCLNNLASLYQNMGEYENAESLFIQSKEIRKNALGEDHPDYAASLNNLAALYVEMWKYEKAELLFIKAKEIWKKILGDKHPNYATSLTNLALCYTCEGNFAMAEPLILASTNIKLYNLRNTFTILSEKEKGSYLANNIMLTQTNNSLLYNYSKSSSALPISNFNLQLFVKSLILSDTRNILESINKNPDSSVKKNFALWQFNKNLLATQYSLPINNQITKLDSIEAITEVQEKELNRKSSEFRTQQKAISISLPDVQNKLKQDEVAIEFVKFRLYNKKATDSTIYAAYILRKDNPIPQFVPLCEENQLGKYFSSAGGAANIKAIYRSDAVDEEEKPSISGDSLYALIWKPLLPYLTGIKKINYSPAGLLYKIAFNALPAGDSLLLIDKYELNQYISVRQLAIEEEKKEKNNSIALFGNCMFTMDSSSIVNTIPQHDNANALITAVINRGANASGWKDLPGTEKEITGIQYIFNTKNITTSEYSQLKATEEQFKSLSGNSPTILHLATHGFFLPDPEIKREEGFEADNRNAFTLADDPLLRSGIVLSGANRVWSGQAPIAGREDGIVTAYEIAQMDLSKTDLVVLSACETALGDIKGNEGVFGLQRAFKLAGVKNMLLSLWKVPDAETAELMKIFYTYYLQGKTARESFAAAQKEMRKKYKPYYWAAFVLIE